VDVEGVGAATAREINKLYFERECAPSSDKTGLPLVEICVGNSSWAKHLDNQRTCLPVHLLEAVAEHCCRWLLWEWGVGSTTTALRRNCAQEMAAVTSQRLSGQRLSGSAGDARSTKIDLKLLWHDD